MSKKVTSFAIGVLTVLLAVSGYFNLKLMERSAQEREVSYEAKKALSELSMEFDSVLTANDSLQSILLEKDYIIDSLQVLNEDSQDQIDWLNGELDGLQDQINAITSDSVYAALRQLYEKGDTILPFRFSDYGIRGMYETALALPLKDGVIVEQADIIARTKIQLDLSEQKVAMLQLDNDSKVDLLEQLYQDLANGTIQYDTLKQDKEDVEKTLRLWKAGSIGAGAAILLIILLI